MPISGSMDLKEKLKMVRQEEISKLIQSMVELNSITL